MSTDANPRKQRNEFIGLKFNRAFSQADLPGILAYVREFADFETQHSSSKYYSRALSSLLANPMNVATAQFRLEMRFAILEAGSRNTQSLGHFWLGLSYFCTTGRTHRAERHFRRCLQLARAHYSEPYIRTMWVAIRTRRIFRIGLSGVSDVWRSCAEENNAYFTDFLLTFCVVSDTHEKWLGKKIDFPLMYLTYNDHYPSHPLQNFLGFCLVMLALWSLMYFLFLR